MSKKVSEQFYKTSKISSSYKNMLEVNVTTHSIKNLKIAQTDKNQQTVHCAICANIRKSKNDCVLLMEAGCRFDNLVNFLALFRGVGLSETGNCSPGFLKVMSLIGIFFPCFFMRQFGHLVVMTSCRLKFRPLWQFLEPTRWTVVKKKILLGTIFFSNCSLIHFASMRFWCNWLTLALMFSN